MKFKIFMYNLLLAGILILPTHATDIQVLPYNDDDKENIEFENVAVPTNNLGKYILPEDSIENDQQDPPSFEILINFESQVKLAKENYDSNQLKILQEEFAQHTEEELVWEERCHVLDIHRWRKQESWKQVYGGSVFYPHEEMEKILGFRKANRYLLQRHDILTCLSIASFYENPIAQFYYSRSNKKTKRRYYNSAYKEIYQDASEEALFLKAYDMAYFECKQEQAIEIYELIGSPSSLLEILNIKSRFKAVFQQPTPEEYIALAENYNFGPALRDLTLDLSMSEEEKIPYLNKALEWGDDHSLWCLGVVHRNLGNEEQALNCFLSYGDKGYSTGYISAGKMFVNPDSLEVFMNPPEEKIVERAREYFMKASELLDPEGMYVLKKWRRFS